MSIKSALASLEAEVKAFFESIRAKFDSLVDSQAPPLNPAAPLEPVIVLVPAVAVPAPVVEPAVAVESPVVPLISAVEPKTP